MKRWQADLALIVIVIIWGSTFFVVHDATRQWPPLAFVALRFSIATLASLPLALPGLLRGRATRARGPDAADGISASIEARRGWTGADWRAGLILGGLLFLGYVTQTTGLALTTASRGGFLTGLNVMLVPLFGALIWRERVRRQVWLGVALAIGGLFVLAQDGAGSGASSLLGDGLVLACAVMFAGHILAVGHFSPGRSIMALNTIQMLVVAVLAWISSLLLEGLPPALPAAVWWAALYLGLVATIVVQWIQLVAQRVASPTHTALIFVLEPVFAALFAWLFGGEQLSMLLAWGGLLMLSGIVLAELPDLRIRRTLVERGNETI